MNILFSIFLYSIQITLPVLAVLIVYYCFKSLFGGIEKKRPLVVLYNKLTKQKIPIIYWENSIGRNKHCDIVLDSPTASRDHAVLFRRDVGWMISDTNSKTGVFINGDQVEDAERVYIDDIIQIGGIDLELQKAEILEPDDNFALKNPPKKQYSQASILCLVSIFHFLACCNLCFASGSFDYKPAMIFILLFGLSWIYFFISKYGFRRSNFELETLGLFLSGVGIITSCGIDPEETYMQMIALAVGMVLFSIMVWFIKNPDFAMHFRPYFAGAAILLLIVNIVFGAVRHGSQNWIIIGPVSVQPSEFVKVAFIFYGASTLERLQTAKNLTAFILFSCACMGALFLMGDFGTACIFFVTFILIAFMRSGSIRTVFLTCVSAVLGLMMILKFKPYIMNRFAAWRHVWGHVNDIGYQQTRVLTYSASGGLFGLGIGKGCLKYVFAAPSDLVFGMLCEEWGLILALVCIVSIAFIAFYARRASAKSRSAFYSISSCCAAGLLLFQMMMNVFGSVDILPLTGVTLPFVSLGGSSLISVWGVLAFIKASDERTYAARRVS